MCLANAYADTVKAEALLMENTKSVEIDGNEVVLKDLFGSTKRVAGTLKFIDLEANRVVIAVA